MKPVFHDVMAAPSLRGATRQSRLGPWGKAPLGDEVPAVGSPKSLGPSARAASLAELIGGLIEADKKKKKRTYAASKYAKLDIQPLPATPPARLARARLPAFVAPAADAPRARRLTANAPRRGRPAGKPKAKRRTKAEMEQARAEERARDSVARAVGPRGATQSLGTKSRPRQGASDELLEYLERPDFLEALTEARAANLPPKVLELQRRVIAKRGAKAETALPPSESPKKRAAAKIRPLVAEFSASVEPKVGLGRFLGRFA